MNTDEKTFVLNTPSIGFKFADRVSILKNCDFSVLEGLGETTGRELYIDCPEEAIGVQD